MILIALLLLSVRTAEPRHAVSGHTALRDERTALASGAARDTETGDTHTWPNPNQIEGVEIIKHPKRIPRGAKDGSSNKRDQSPHNYWHPRAHDPDSYFTTPKSAQYPSGGALNHGSRTNSSDKVTVFLHNPLYPVTESSYGAYAVMLLALILFAVGIVGNLALMCIVWHNYYLKSAWNCILASLAFWDFLVLFFCLPVVIFNELTTKRLMGDLSCRIVPYMEITSQGVATFSLCALSIDRFHAATAPRPQRSSPRVEPCHSILAKLAVIWLGSLVLAGPELLLWQLDQGGSAVARGNGAPVGLRSPRDAAERPARGVAPLPPADTCVRRPSVDLPESVYALVLTYHEARMWWYFGCYFCLPLLFTLACQLVTRHVAAQEATPAPPPKKGGAGRPSSSSTSSSSTSSSSSAAPKKKSAGRERRLSSAVAALAAVYAACNLPENACGVALAYVTGPVSPAAEAVIALVGQFLMFARCAATPVLLLSLCRPLGRAFMDCCCCCCDECLPDGGGGASSSSAASTIATATSACSSPTSLSPPSLPAPTATAAAREEKVKVVSGSSPTIYYDRVKESSAVLAIGTPC